MSAIQLRELSVHNIHGKSSRLTLRDLQPGINAVYGHNSTGKSTLAKAGTLIFSASASELTNHLSAVLAMPDGEVVNVNVLGNRADAVVAQSPRPDLYRIGIDQLIAGPTDRDSQLVRDAFAGGMSLSEILAQRPSKALKPVVDKLAAASRQVEIERRSAAVVTDKLSGIAELEADVQADEARLRLTQRGHLLLGARDATAKAEDAARQARHLVEQQPGVDRQLPDAVTSAEDLLAAFNKRQTDLANIERQLAEHGGNHAVSLLDVGHKASMHQGIEAANTARNDRQAENAARDEVQRQIRQLENSLPDDKIAATPLTLVATQELESVLLGWRKCDDELKLAEGARSTADGSLRQATQAFVTSGGDTHHFPETLPAPSLIAEAVGLDEQIGNAAAMLVAAENEQGNAQRRLTAVEATLPDGYTPAYEAEALKALGPDALPAAVDAVVAARARKSGYTQLRTTLRSRTGEAQIPADDQLDADRNLLVEWLKSAPDVVAKAAQAFPFALAAIVAGIIASVLLIAGLIAAAAVVKVVAIAGGIVVIMIAGWLFVAGKTVATPAENRQASILTNRAPALGLAKPDTTTVVAKLAELTAKIERQKALTGLLDTLGTLENAVNADAEERMLLAAIETFTGQTGITVTGVALAPIVTRFIALATERSALHVALQRVKAAKTTHDDLLARRTELCSALPLAASTGAAARAWYDAALQLKAVMEEQQSCSKIVRDLQEHKNGLLSRAECVVAAHGWAAGDDVPATLQRFRSWHADSIKLTALKADLHAIDLRIMSIDARRAAAAAAVQAVFECYAYPAALRREVDPMALVDSFQQWMDLSRRHADASSEVSTARASLHAYLDNSGIPTNDDIKLRLQELRERKDAVGALAALLSNEKRYTNNAQTLTDSSALTPADWALFGLEADADTHAIRALLDSYTMLPDRIKVNRDALQQIQSDAAVLEAGTADVDKHNVMDAVADASAWIAGQALRAATDTVRSQVELAVRKENTPAVVESANRWLMRLAGGKYSNLQLAADPGKPDKACLVVTDLKTGSTQKVSELSTGTRAHLALSVRIAAIEVAEAGGTRLPLFLDEVMATSDSNASREIATAAIELARDRQVIVLTNQPDDIALLVEAGVPQSAIQSLGEQPLMLVTPVGLPALPTNETATSAPLDPFVPGTDTVPLHAATRLWHPQRLRGLLTVSATPDDTTVAEMLVHSVDPFDHEIVDAVEAARNFLAALYPRLEWSALKDVNLGKFEEEVRLLVEGCNGDIQLLMQQAKALPNMRTATVQRLRDHLKDRGFFAESPPFEDVRDVAFGALSERLPTRQRVAERIATLFRRYTHPSEAHSEHSPETPAR